MMNFGSRKLSLHSNALFTSFLSRIPQEGKTRGYSAGKKRKKKIGCEVISRAIWVEEEKDLWRRLARREVSGLIDRGSI